MTPALTAEEWGAAIYRGDFGYFAVTEEVSDHGRAALCLYGQPFGFTPEDVYKLGHVRHYLERGIGSQADLLAVLDSIAAKIAALLPPEN